MAKVGKLTKLIKKLSFRKSLRTNNTSLETMSSKGSLGSNISFSSSSSIVSSSPSATLHPVYVGKSMRQYLLTSDVVRNSLFQQLVGGGDGEEISVGCEVVLFEHLLWMLENADPQPESLDELVQFYAC